MSCKAWIDPNSPYLADLNLSASESARARKACEAATTALERALHRSIPKAQHDHRCTANDDGSVILPNFPVISVDRIYDGQEEALRIVNDGASVSNASFSTTATALKLSHTLSGVVDTEELEYTDYPTLSALATAIGNIGSGWSATVVGDYGAFASADLATKQYGNCKSEVGLDLWTQGDGGWYLASEDQGLVEGFRRGQQVRIVYTAGFADIPEDLKQVCAQVVKDMMGDNSASIQSESLGGYSYSLAQGIVSRLPRNAREILATYKDRLV